MTEAQRDRLTLVLATHNADKVRELRRLLIRLQSASDDAQATGDEAHWRIVAASELGAAPQVSEDAATLAGNARQKAVIIARWSGLPSLADDTGLEVDALGGRPGVWAHRYAGPTATYADNRRLLLQELADVPEERRAARFRTVVAIAIPRSWWQHSPVALAAQPGTGRGLSEPAATPGHAVASGDDLELYEAEGVLEGRIARTEQGSGGFGYDPVFELPDWGCTLAQLSLDRKNEVSHRARAVQAAWPILRELAQRWRGGS